MLVLHTLCKAALATSSLLCVVRHVAGVLPASVQGLCCCIWPGDFDLSIVSTFQLVTGVSSARVRACVLFEFPSHSWTQPFGVGQWVFPRPLFPRSLLCIVLHACWIPTSSPESSSLFWKAAILLFGYKFSRGTKVSTSAIPVGIAL